MKIAILGGTGDIGEGLALRWAKKHEIIIGSRNIEKAREASARYIELLKQANISAQISGVENHVAAKVSEVVVFSIPYQHAISTAMQLKNSFTDQIVISPIVPMSKKDRYYYDPSKDGCAALELKAALPESVKVVAAFQTIPANKLRNLDLQLDSDVVVCSDNAEAKQTVMKLVREIPNLRPLDGGTLESACYIESLTPLLINLAIENKMKDLSIKFL